MSTLDQTIPPSLAEQARLELNMAASGSERANRPRGFLYGAIALLIVASIYMLFGVRFRSSALARVEAARQQSGKIIELANETRALQSSLASRGVDYNPQMPIFLEQLAREKHAEPASAITEIGVGSSVANMQQKKYRATFVNQDPEALLAFLNATQESPLTAGIEISRLEVKPGAPNETTGQVLWKLDVDFSRWERKR